MNDQIPGPCTYCGSPDHWRPDCPEIAELERQRRMPTTTGNILFFDTETTGKLDFRNPNKPERQPRLVQLAAMLTDSTGKPIGSLSTLIKPDGWTIPKEAENVHGVSTAMAEANGIPIIVALSVFHHFAAAVDTMVAHSIEFDDVVMRSEFARASKPYNDKLRRFCTMKASTDICKIPGPYGFKWPKLIEAHKKLLGVSFYGAHDAMADTLACMRVFFALKAKEENKVLCDLCDKPYSGDHRDPVSNLPRHPECVPF